MPYLDWDLPKGKAYEWFVATPGAIVLIILVGLVFRWFLSRSIDRVVRRATAAAVPSVLANSRAGEFLADLRPGSQERRKQRAETMGSLLKSIATGVILAIVVVMIMSQLGTDIAPIIASAGIVGVALGIGAQNLVKDFLAGIFMILEDQYGVGDVVDLGEASGSVEAVGLRVTRLRDADGAVWYVRNGEVLRVGNRSQGFAQVIIDLPVPYGADLTAVGATMKAAADELAAQPDWEDAVLEQPELLGVEQIGQERVVLRLTVKVRPPDQWQLARELRRRIADRLDVDGTPRDHAKDLAVRTRPARDATAVAAETPPPHETT